MASVKTLYLMIHLIYYKCPFRMSNEIQIRQMLPSGLVYSLPNLPSSVTNFGGPIVFSNTRLQNISCIIDATQERGALYLGDTLSTKQIQNLIRYNIQAVLSCALEAIFIHPADPKVNVVATKFICALDSLNYDISQHFEETFDFIEENLSKKLNVLVHCHAGVSRSAAIVIAYVMKKLGLNFEAAFEFVKARRSRIRPNERFRNYLKEFQQKITLNSFSGNLTEKQMSLQKNTIDAIDYHPVSLTSNNSSERIGIRSERPSQFANSYSNFKGDHTIMRKEEEVGYQQSGLSITQLLLKADGDANSQRELQHKLNQFSAQLQNQTNALFGKDQVPKKTIQNINRTHYGAPLPPREQVQTRQYASYPYNFPVQNARINSQRNIQYLPVQTQSLRTFMEKRVNTDKPKTTVVQGGLPQSYKSIAGMMAPSSSRYQTGDYYYDRRY